MVLRIGLLLHVPLTSACCEDSNIYGLENTLSIRDLTVVDTIHTTSPPDHTHHTRTSNSVKVPHKMLCIDNHVGKPSSIGKEPVPQDSSTIGTSVSCAQESSGIIITNVFQSYETVVLVSCTLECEPDIT